MEKNRNKNQGFSLIEVIVIVLILGIISTITVLSVSYAYGSNANHCAKRLSSLLDYTRTQSLEMVEGTVCLRLSIESDGSIQAISIKQLGDLETELDREKIGNSSLTVYSKKDGIEFQKLDVGSSIDFKYSKNTGAFLASTMPYTMIKFEGSKTATLILVKETGRNYIK